MAEPAASAQETPDDRTEGQVERASSHKGTPASARVVRGDATLPPLSSTHTRAAPVSSLRTPLQRGVRRLRPPSVGLLGTPATPGGGSPRASAVASPRVRTGTGEWVNRGNGGSGSGAGGDNSGARLGGSSAGDVAVADDVFDDHGLVGAGGGLPAGVASVGSPAGTRAVQRSKSMAPRVIRHIRSVSGDGTPSVVPGQSLTPGPGALRPSVARRPRRTASFDEPNHAAAGDQGRAANVPGGGPGGVTLPGVSHGRGRGMSLTAAAMSPQLGSATSDRGYIRGGLFQLIFSTFGLVTASVLFITWLTMRPFAVPLFWATLFSIPMRYAKRRTVDLLVSLAILTGCVDEDYDATSIGGSTSARDPFWWEARRMPAQGRSAPYLYLLFAALVGYLLAQVLSLEVVVVIGIVLAAVAAFVSLMYLAWVVRWAISLTPWAQGVISAGSVHFVPVALWKLVCRVWAWGTSRSPVVFLWEVFKDVFQTVGKGVVEHLNLCVTLLVITSCGLVIMGLPVIVMVQLSQESAAFAERTWVTHNAGILRSVQSAFELPAPLVVDAPFLDSKDGVTVLFNNQAERHWALPFDASNLDKCPSHVVGDWPLKQRGAQQCEPLNGLFQAAQVESNGNVVGAMNSAGQDHDPGPHPHPRDDIQRGPATLYLEFEKGYDLTRYSLSLANTTQVWPTAWTVYASNDGTTWEPAHTVTNASWGGDLIVEAVLSFDKTTYRYFRVELSEFCVSDTGADAASAHGVRELRLMAVRLYWTGVMEIARDLTDQVKAWWIGYTEDQPALRELMNGVLELVTMGRNNSATSGTGPKVQAVADRWQKGQLDWDMPWVMYEAIKEVVTDLKRAKLLNFNAVSERLFALVKSFLSTFATGGLTILGWLQTMFDALINFLIFLKVLFLLVVVTDRNTHTLLHRIAPMRLKGTTSEQVLDAFSRPIRGVFGSSVKLVVFYGVYTWLVFKLFELPLPVTASIASSILSIIPLIPVFIVFVPPAVGIWIQGDMLTALVILSLGGWLWWGYAAEAIYNDIPNSPHPYVTGLSVIGGLYFAGASGALIGPMLMTFPIIVVNLYKQYKAWHDWGLPDATRSNSRTVTPRTYVGGTRDIGGERVVNSAR